MECLKCEGLIETLGDRIYELECYINKLEQEINRRDDIELDKQTWSVEL